MAGNSFFRSMRRASTQLLFVGGRKSHRWKFGSPTTENQAILTRTLLSGKESSHARGDDFSL